MRADPIANFAASLVATAPSPATSGTTVTVTSGDGARFPDPATLGPYNVVMVPVGTAPEDFYTDAEIARVTAKSGDTLTITRAQEGTTARSVATGWLIYQGPTARAIENAMPPVPTGLWYHHPGQLSTVALTLNVMRLYPVRLVRQQHTNIQLEVTTLGASGLIRIGFYANDDNNGLLPDITAGPLLDAGTQSSNTTGAKTWSGLTFTPPQEVVWFAVVAQTIGCTVRGNVATTMYQDLPIILPSGQTPNTNSSRLGLAIASVSGALPSSGSLTMDNALVPKAFFKVA